MAFGISNTDGERWFYRILVTLFGALVIALGLLLYTYGAHWLTDYQWRLLEARADERLGDNEIWLQQRRVEALRLVESRPYRQTVQGLLTTEKVPLEQTKALKDEIQFLLTRENYQAIGLFDAEGQVRFVEGDVEVEPSLISFGINEVVKRRRVVFCDTSVPASERPTRDARIIMFAPVFTENQVAGILVFWHRADLYRSPLVEQWTTFQSSAEVLVFRGESGKIVFLTQPGFGYPRIIDAAPGLLTTQAVAKGYGRVEGGDYRGEASMGVVRRIADSPWFLLAKVDRDEALTVVRQLAAGMMFITLLLLSGGGLLVRNRWRRQQAERRAADYRAEMEKQALARHFDYLAKYANDIIILADETGHIVEVNDRATETYGYSRDELRQMNVVDLRGKVGGKEAAAALWAGVSETQAALFEMIHRSRDGKTFPVEVSARAIKTDDKTYYQEIIRDITERKRVEAALLESEARLRLMVENLPAGAVYHEGNKILFNRAAEVITGYSRSEITTLDTWFSRLHGDRAQHVRAQFDEDRKAGFTRTRIIPLVTKAGQARLVEFAAYAAPEAEVWLLTDVTEREHAEEALRNLNEQLQRTLAELRSSQEQVVQTEKIAALGTMAAGIAHEVNNPLMGVMNYVSYVRTHLERPDATDKLLAAEHQLERIKELLKSMLTFARPVAGKASNVSINELLKNVLDLLGGDFRAQGITVETRVATEVPQVIAKPSRLQQVFINLLLNARDAVVGTPEKRVTISVWHEGKNVFIEFADTGHGIPESIQDKIFDPFFTTKPPGKGTGMGLSVSRSIIDDLGGNIDVTSEEGKGSRFVVRLNVAD